MNNDPTYRNGRRKGVVPLIHICEIDWVGGIAAVIMPFLYGSHNDSQESTRNDGYVSAQGIPSREDVMAGNITLGDLELLDRVQRGEHGNDQFLRNTKSTHRSPNRNL